MNAISLQRELYFEFLVFVKETLYPVVSDRIYFMFSRLHFKCLKHFFVFFLTVHSYDVILNVFK